MISDREKKKPQSKRYQFQKLNFFFTKCVNGRAVVRGFNVESTCLKCHLDDVVNFMLNFTPSNRFIFGFELRNEIFHFRAFPKREVLFRICKKNKYNQKNQQT